MDSSDFADFECFARTGANAPATIFPKLSDGCEIRPGSVGADNIA